MIPNFMHMKIVDKDGNPTPEYFNFMQQLVETLQQNFTNEGYKIPSQDSDNIAILSNPKSTRTLIYDGDTHELKINLNGTFKTIQTS